MSVANATNIPVFMLNTTIGIASIKLAKDKNDILLLGIIVPKYRHTRVIAAVILL